MPLSHMRRRVVLGAGLLSATLVAGVTLVLERSWQASAGAARASVERTAQAVANGFNRHLLQIDSTLAGLPALLGAVAPGGSASPEAAHGLLRELKAQSLDLRDLVILRPDRTVWAGAAADRTRRAPEALMAPSEGGAVASTLGGPWRNPRTGDWSLFLSRPVQLRGAGELVAVAEIALTSLTSTLAAVSGEVPGLVVALEHADGRLVARLPHDERATGERLPAPVTQAGGLTGKAFEWSPRPGASPALAVVHATLYGDISLAVTQDLGQAVTAWSRDRDRLLAMLALAEALLILGAGSLIWALRRHDRLVAEREQARQILENAVEAMSDGFVMWDEEDRLLTCNRKYLDLYAPSAPAIRKGARFEDIMRYGAENGQYPQAGDDIDGFVARVIEWHRRTQGVIERLLPDGRWLLVTERRTASGQIVGIRTDITALKNAQAELEAANERARSATAEAHSQNAALVERERHIRYLAHHDALTGLPNRVLFRARLDEMLQAGADAETGVGLLFLDLDKFKDVNDTLGHPVGDALLEAVARRLRACVKEADVVARLGGDEFAVAFVARDPARTAARLAERLIAELGATFELAGRPVVVGASVGVAVAVAAAATDADTLLRNADMALYEAKAGGRGVSRFFEAGIEARLRERLETERDLKVALAEQQFAMVYQPIVDLATNRVRGFEALLRWHHPERGVVGPASFVGLAEEIGLIEEIGAFVLEQACADAALLPRDTRMSVNLSPVQLRSDAIFDTVTAALRRSELEPERLELEVTESALLENNERVASLLGRLRALGVRIVLDDFGTGYSSLSYLRNLPFQKVKIDQSFVREMTTRANSAAIVSAIVGLADELGITTTAEGVETADHLAFVRRVGCGEAQGYYLGEPQTILGAFAALERADLPSAEVMPLRPKAATQR